VTGISFWVGWTTAWIISKEQVSQLTLKNRKRKNYNKLTKSRSEWFHGLRCGSGATRLLGMWVQIPPAAQVLVFASAVCCNVEFSALGWSFVQSSPTDCGMSTFGLITKPRKGKPWHGIGPQRHKKRAQTSNKHVTRLVYIGTFVKFQIT
jgi:hypothetical protein